MTLQNKKSQINILKAELCIEYMKAILKPKTEMFEVINQAIYLRSLMFQILTIQSQPIYPSGCVEVGNNTKKEVIIKN